MKEFLNLYSKKEIITLIKYILFKLINLFLIKVSMDYLIHPFHLHGTNFHVFDMGRVSENRNITLQDIELVIEMHEKRLKENMYDKPGQKDTILIPLNGWVIFRYIAVNPGKK